VFSGEEIIRAYVMYRVVELVGDTRIGWICALVVSSLLYVLNHLYQGLAGSIGVVVTCFVLGMLYLLSKRNLWSNIICHGLNDTVAFLAIIVGLLR
jgi:uncharacterized protein